MKMQLFNHQLLAALAAAYFYSAEGAPVDVTAAVAVPCAPLSQFTTTIRGRYSLRIIEWFLTERATSTL